MRKQWINSFLLAWLLTGAANDLHAQEVDNCTFYTNKYEQKLKCNELIKADSLIGLLRAIQILRCPNGQAAINRKKDNLDKLYTVILADNSGWATLRRAKVGTLVAINQEFAITGQLKEHVIELYPFSYDLYRVKDVLGAYTLIDRSGRFITSTSYDSIWNFEPNGYAGVQKNGKIGIIDKEGKEVVKPWINGFSNGVASISIGGKYGFINKQGKVVIPAIYSWGENLDNGYVLLQNNSSKYYFLDIKTNDSSTKFDDVTFLKVAMEF